MRIKTPAKINTCLYILNKRPDGFHELYTHMVPINLFDTIHFESNSNQGIQLEINGKPCGNPANNLIVQAAQKFEMQANVSVNMNFTLLKKIPVGAGLGGGSGNAAGVIQALNQFYNKPLQETELYQIASELGSDIPFFLKPCPSEAKGRGEKLSPFSHFPSFQAVVVAPPFSISTPEAYRNCQPSIPSVLPRNVTTFHDLAKSVFNQFETTLIPTFPQLSKIKQTLLDQGAVAASVSGSGSSVFGLFSDNDTMNQAHSELEAEDIGELFCCESLLLHQYTPY